MNVIHGVNWQPTNMIPIRGAVGKFFYDVKKDISTHDPVQKSIWGFIEDTSFSKILNRVENHHQTRFQEMVFSPCAERIVETSEFQLKNGLVVVDTYMKIFDANNELCFIEGQTKVA